MGKDCSLQFLMRVGNCGQGYISHLEVYGDLGLTWFVRGFGFHEDAHLFLGLTYPMLAKAEYKILLVMTFALHTKRVSIGKVITKFGP